MAVEDGAIVTRTKLALASDERCGLLDVEVTAVDGLVFLRGVVESEGERAAAVAVAAAVEGVRGVCCELTLLNVHPPAHEHLDRPPEPDPTVAKGI